MDQDLRRLETEVTSVIAGLTVSQTQAAPRDQPDKWSIQQIVEHLLQTYRTSIPAIQARLDKGRPTRAVPTSKQKINQFAVITLGRFPSGLDAPAIVSPTQPSTLRSGDELLSKISAELMLLDAVTAYGERLFGSQRAVSHMVLGPLSMQQWRRFHLIHGLHHIAQIRAICLEHSIQSRIQPSSSMSSSTLKYRRM